MGAIYLVFTYFVRKLFAVVLLLLLTLCVNQDIFVQFHAASLFPLPFCSVCDQFP